MFINRDWTRTEEDDFKLNVQPRLDSVVGQFGFPQGKSGGAYDFA